MPLSDYVVHTSVQYVYSMCTVGFMVQTYIHVHVDVWTLMYVHTYVLVLVLVLVLHT